MNKIKIIFKALILLGSLLFLSNTNTALAEEMNLTKNDALYCNIIAGKNGRFAIDFIFIVNMQGKIQDAAKIIKSIGTKQFLKNYLSDDIIYFYDQKGNMRKITNISFTDSSYYSVQLAKGDCLFNDPKTKGRRTLSKEIYYFGSNKQSKILKIHFFNKNIDADLYKNYLKIKKTHINCVIRAIEKRLKDRDINTKINLEKSIFDEEVILFDLDSDTLKDQIISPKILFSSVSDSGQKIDFWSHASLLVIYGNGNHKSVCYFEGKHDPPAESSQIISILDYDKNGKYEILLFNTIKEMRYYLLLNGENPNNIIFRSFPRSMRRSMR